MPLAEDSVKAKTLFSLVHTLLMSDINFDFGLRISCDIIGNRAGLVEQARKVKATHILFVDHDMYFPPMKTDKGFESAVTRLLSRDKDIIGVPYNFRSLPLKSTASPIEETSDEPYKCNVVGTGLLLIKLSVFDKLEKPYFQFGRNEDSEMVYGEDTYFCQQAIKAGFDVWADPTIEVKHIGEYLY